MTKNIVKLEITVITLHMYNLNYEMLKKVAI